MGCHFRTIACFVVAAAVGGCARSGTMLPVPQGLPGSSILTAPKASAGFKFYTVDYPHKSPNRITGIADNQEIVGVYGTSRTQNPYHSYTSQYDSRQPYSKFQRDDYPNSPITYMASISVAHSGNSIQAGYVITPGDLHGNWGVINSNGLWTLIRRHRGEGHCHMMELFGSNIGNDFAVGFYWQDDSPPSGFCSKHTQYITEVRPGEGFHDFPQVTGRNPVAEGVTKSGWLLGITDSSGSEPTQGWTKMYCKGCRKGTQVKYWNYKNDRHSSTQLLGVNDSGVAVGTYQNANGSWHGLIATNLFSISKQPKWQSIDEPDGNQTSTVISGIDNSGDICGWYTGTDGRTHGFVAIHQ